MSKHNTLTNNDGTSTTQQFIVKLESAAKRVLKEANKKARDALLAEQTAAILQGKRAERERSNKRDKKNTTVRMSHTQLGSSQNLNDDPTMGLGRAPPGTDTLDMRYSVPKMFVSMAMDNTLDLMGSMDMQGGDNQGMGRSMGKQLKRGGMSPRATSAGSMSNGSGNGNSASGPLSPIKKKQQLTAGNAMSSSLQMSNGMGTTKLMNQTQHDRHRKSVGDKIESKLTKLSKTLPQRNKVLEALSTSAYVTAATGTLDEIMLARRQEAERLKQTRKSEAEQAPEKETTWALKSHVSEVMSGKNSGAGKLHRKLLKQQAAKKAGGEAGRQQEQQGPIDWSTNGLKIKYRGEAEREAAYRSWETANAFR